MESTQSVKETILNHPIDYIQQLYKEHISKVAQQSS